MLAIQDYQQARTTHTILKDTLQKICGSFNSMEEAQNMLDLAEQSLSSKNVANVFDNQIVPAIVDFDKSVESFLTELDEFIKATETVLEADSEEEKTSVITKYTV